MYTTELNLHHRQQSNMENETKALKHTSFEHTDHIELRTELHEYEC